MSDNAVLERLETLAPRRGFTLVGIGGHGAAGKTTLARMIPAAQIVGTDEFWDGESFAISRLRQEVLTPLLEGRVARFTGYDWRMQRPAATERLVQPADVVVIEGVCALHRTLRDDYDLRVWVDAPYELRLERGIARDGEGMRRQWVEVWIPGEERYVAADDPVSCADVVVDGALLIEPPAVQPRL